VNSIINHYTFNTCTLGENDYVVHIKDLINHFYQITVTGAHRQFVLNQYAQFDNEY